MKSVQWDVYIADRPMIPDMPFDDGSPPSLNGNLGTASNPNYIPALMCALVKTELLPVEESLMFTLNIEDNIETGERHYHKSKYY